MALKDVLGANKKKRFKKEEQRTQLIQKMNAKKAEYTDYIMNNRKYVDTLTDVESLRPFINTLYTRASLPPPKNIFLANNSRDLKKILYYLLTSDKLNQKSENIDLDIFKGTRHEAFQSGYTAISKYLKPNDVEEEDDPNSLYKTVYDSMFGRNDQMAIVMRELKSDYINFLRNEFGSKDFIRKLYESTLIGLYENVFTIRYLLVFRELLEPKTLEYIDFLQDNALLNLVFFNNFVIIGQMPEKIRVNERGRLHSTDEAALIFRGNEHHYYLHGVKFSKEDWERVVSGNIKFEEILKMSNNIEVRRAAFGTVGYEKIFTSVPDKYKQLLSSEDGYELWNVSKDLFNDQDLTNDMRVLRYKCPSTGRQYVDTVPQIGRVHDQDIELNKALDAAAWKFGKTRKEFKEGLVAES